MDTSLLSFEEKRTVKWFLSLFYTILIFFDLFYYFIYPKFVLHEQVGFPNFFGYWTYFILLGLLPMVFYLFKKDQPYKVKYIYFIAYITLAIINDIYTYWGNSDSYTSGNAVEVFLVLFSPIFVNKRFYWLVSVGSIFKYLLVGIVINSPNVIIPIMLILVLSIIAYILLNRFQGYVAAVKKSFDMQLEGIVKGVIATLELKDPYTSGHSERVANYALSLAKQTGIFSKDELKSFNYACLLHDIGKINIPDHILMKPSKLTDEEFKIIMTHPIVGAKAVEKVEGLTNSLSVIRSHHERWDGNGYPDQLEGKDIPLLARIAAIADAFDAMTSSRSYRGALDKEEAYKRIIEGKGTQFDPDLVEVFKSVYPSWVKP